MSDSIGNLSSTGNNQDNTNTKSDTFQEEIGQILNPSKQTYVVLSREEVLKKRKERNKAKKDEKIRERECKLFEERVKKSEKIKTLIHEDFTKIQANQSVQHKPKYKKLESFNILDFIVTKNVVNKKHKTFNNSINRAPKFQIKRGKKYQNKVKVARSRLKKAIIRSRLLRNQLISHNIVLNEEFKDDKNLKTDENPKSLLEEHENPKSSLEEQSSLSNVQTNSDSINLNLENCTINKFEELTLDDHNNMKRNIHSRKFRSYCDNLTSSVLRKLTEDLIRKIYAFQKRAYQKNEIKAKAHRRYVMGFKETKRSLNIGKVKLVIIAPDCEQCDETDGIQETISWIKDKCNENEVPYLFSLRARQIAYCLYIKVPIYCLGIISYDGAQDIYIELVKCLAIERQNYLALCNNDLLDSNEIVEPNQSIE